jgi:hypothetical protein
VFKYSTRYNESIETPTTSLALSFVKAKESTLRYVCNSLGDFCCGWEPNGSHKMHDPSTHP